MSLKPEAEFLVQEWLRSWKDFGVGDVLQTPVDFKLGVQAQPCLVLLFPLAKPAFSEEEHALAIKMMGAIGLSSDQVGAVFEDSETCFGLDTLTNPLPTSGALYLCFGSAIKFSEKNPVETHPLSEVLKNPALKKPVWETLKDLRQQIKN